MADVIGRNSYVPGQQLKVPDGTMCDEHADRPATHRIVGESDSFGSELVDFCEECYQKYQKAKSSALLEEKYCEICKNMKKFVKPRRDPEEGSSGRVYEMCSLCHSKMIDDFVNDDN